MLGENFMNEAYGQGQQPGVRRNASGRVQPAGQQGQGQHVYPPPPQADLGIMKALSSMGSAAKRNLTQLAQGFNSGGGTGGANSNTASSGTRSNRNSGENVSYVSRGGFGGGTPAASTAGKAPARSASHQARKKGSFNDLEVMYVAIFAAKYMLLCLRMHSMHSYDCVVLASATDPTHKTFI